MSTNLKNRTSSAYFRNFTKMVERRTILIDKNLSSSSNFEHRIRIVNEELNELIQNLNIKIWKRLIPYFTLQIQYGSVIEKDTRIFVHDCDTPIAIENSVKEQLDGTANVSHILNVLVAHSYKEIKISNISCDAEIIIDDDLFECAVTDILLDIAMFNSFSFLRNLSEKERRIFSKQKLHFYQKNNLGCYYRCDSKRILYYSFAFSARTSEDYIDLNKYIEIWTAFLQEYYPNGTHVEHNIKNQISFHIDYQELPQKLHLNISKMEDGAYLILRTNKDRTTDIHDAIYSIFGIDAFAKGKVRIVPIADYEKYIELLKNLDVSAFKVVKDSTTSL